MRWVYLGSLSVSPPTRGWTGNEHAYEYRFDGFPAHAGMDRAPSGAPSMSCRFPRPRGDGPVMPAAALIWSVVSPPTRGWT